MRATVPTSGSVLDRVAGSTSVPRPEEGRHARDDHRHRPRERDGLYELIRSHLSGIEGFWVALERTKDIVTAERLGLEFAEDFRLLQDIGWSDTTFANGGC